MTAIAYKLVRVEGLEPPVAHPFTGTCFEDKPEYTRINSFLFKPLRCNFGKICITPSFTSDILMIRTLIIRAADTSVVRSNLRILRPHNVRNYGNLQTQQTKNRAIKLSKNKSIKTKSPLTFDQRATFLTYLLYLRRQSGLRGCP